MAFYEIAVDLGSKYIYMGIKGTDRVLKEPSVVAVSNYSEKVVAYGYEAERMFCSDKTAARLVYPIVCGAIADKNAAVELIKRMCKALLPQAVYEPQIKADVAVAIGVSNSDLKAIENAFSAAGVAPIEFIESAYAAAKYVFKQFKTNCGIIMNIGHEKSEIAAVENNKIIDGCCLFLGGKYIDMGILYVIENKFKICVDCDTASKIKEKCVSFNNKDVTTTIAKGVGVTSQAISEVRVAARDFIEAAIENVERIVIAANSLLNTIGDLRDIKSSGVFIVGGGAKMYGIDVFVNNILNIPVRIPKEPENAVVLGMM
ncbi:MAG: rod shape-determining protein [Clostridia bacterium]